jgi:DNA mismatch repair protein MutS2
MHPAVLRALEFDRICDALARETLTPLGRARTLDLEPATDAIEVQRRLTLTSEAATFVRGGGSLAIYSPEGLLAILEACGIDAQPLEPVQLLGLARFTESVTTTSQLIATTTTGRSEYSLLGRLVEGTPSFDEEIQAVRRAIHSSGEVNDDASPLLNDVRAKLRRQRAKLRSTLEGLIRGRETAKYLQDQIITDRNGRYVLVMRAEHREAIPGIVHGSSASGASLFVEPLTTLELNNEIVGLAEQEREEVRRILLSLTDGFRGREADFSAVLDLAAYIDDLHARVEFARRFDGIAPLLASDGRVELRGARHPLLIPAVRDLLDTESTATDHAEGAYAEPSAAPRPPLAPVGNDLLVVPPVGALVISGPNTGGKTVALKAVGLLTLMAQAGLLLPVDPGSALTVFECVFADIGDEQSISASLSTFSAHVANIVSMDRALKTPALVLLDEVGGGTDPIEGGALGTAIIEHFRRRGATIVATTHDDALKSYAATTEGVETAAFGFNPQTYAPTYKLIYGAPGRSLAFEIAERLGMPATVIAAARSRRSGRESQLAEHLARVDRELAALETERTRLAGDQQRLESERRMLVDCESKLTEREAVLKRRMDEKLNDRLREARQEVDKIVADLKGRAGSLVQRAERRAQTPISTGEIGGLRANARTALETVAERLDAASGLIQHAERERLSTAPDIGQQVYVTTFSAEGVVRAVTGKHVEVDVRGKRTRVGLSDLRAASPATQSRDKTAARSRVPQPQPAPSGSVSGPARELVLIGATVDDAIDRIEKSLDAALLTDDRRLRVVHGHGTGRLRDALRKFLKQHPLVSSVSPAADNEGGDAATIVELKD